MVFGLKLIIFGCSQILWMPTNEILLAAGLELMWVRRRAQVLPTESSPINTTKPFMFQKLNYMYVFK